MEPVDERPAGRMNENIKQWDQSWTGNQEQWYTWKFAGRLLPVEQRLQSEGPRSVPTKLCAHSTCRLKETSGVG